MHIHLYSKQIALTSRVLFLSSENASNFRISLHQLDATSENIDVKFTLTPDLKEHDAKEWKKLLVRKQPYYGILGILKIGQDSFLLMVSGAKEIGQILGKAIFQITNVDAFSLSSYRYDAVFHSWNTYDNVSVDEVDRLHLESHPCFDILKYLSSGSFYFSSTWNLSVSFQKIFSNPFPTEYSNSSFLYDDGGSCGVDRRFWWNRNLLLPLLIFSAYLEANLKEIFENSDFLIPIISGFVYIRPLTESQPSFILISRLGAKRAGTRFLSRGLDDEGNVANFVETEFVLLQRNFLFSLIQIRGSVPIFWEQQGIQLVQPRLQFTRSFDATQIAFRNHFDDLLHHYGEVHVVNLLSSKEGTPENGLRQTFERHLSTLEKNKPVGYTSFDFNASAKDSFSKVTRILEYIGQNIEAGQFFLYDLTWRSIISTQNSTFRVNCLDCLDRTNVVQGCIAKYALDFFWKAYCSETSAFSANSFLFDFNNAWADSGDILSVLYAGTGALKSGYTRTGKRTFAGLMDDLRKSTQRLYLNNFQDKSRQQTIDYILGKEKLQKLPQISSVTAEMIKTYLDDKLHYETNVSSLKIYSVTWNVHAVHPGDINIMSLLSPLWKQETEEFRIPDVMYFGFQEIVEMTAQQILSTDLNRRLLWEDHLLAILNSAFGTGIFRLLTSVSLVGILGLVIVKSDLLPLFRRVECFSRKTGLSGITGNKGTIGVRCFYGNHPLCFLCSHMAAGQENVTIRNREYWTTFQESIFPSGSTIKDHDVIIWSGDFNYRLDMSVDAATSWLQAKDYSQLLMFCQLLREKKSSNIFGYFEEPEIAFPPTYRFVVNSDLYDTTQRVPGWTDRIFSKGVLNLAYSWIEDVMYSDHRPVFGYYYFKTNYLPPSSSSSQKLIPYSKSLLSAEQHLKQFRSQSPSQSIEAFRKSQDIPSLRSSTSSLLTGSSSLPSTPISLPINTPSLSNLISRPPPPVPIQRVTNEPGNSLIDFSDSAALPVPPTIAVEDSTAEAAESFSAPSIDRWWE